VNGTTVTASPVIDGPALQITLPATIGAGTSVTVSANNLANPIGGTLALSLAAGAGPAVSAPYTINQGAASLQSGFETLFGRALLVLPHFTPSSGAALAASVLSAGQRATQDAVALWIQQLTYVRPAIDRLDRVTAIAQMLVPASPPATWAVLQQPYDPADVWIATQSSPATVLTPGRLSCVLQLPPSQTIGFTGVAGLCVDEWSERVPNAAETTALTFHYEEPTARAPQALIMAVTPTAGSWDWTASPPPALPASDPIVTMLQSTLELAKIRTVDPQTLADGAQFLPLMYMPTNLAGASTGASTEEQMK